MCWVDTEMKICYDDTVIFLTVERTKRGNVPINSRPWQLLCWFRFLKAQTRII
uniref:Uncharacterized protein n=1 Tax=Anguilla anguilla TaxID=7936 RepID=A0A0E9X0P0_ANGAN